MMVTLCFSTVKMLALSTEYFGGCDDLNSELSIQINHGMTYRYIPHNIRLKCQMVLLVDGVPNNAFIPLLFWSFKW